MEKSALKNILEELQFSAFLPEEVLWQLAEESSIESVASGQILFREGSESYKLHVVRSGRIALDMNVPGRGAVRILTLEAGQMVGWSALLNHGRMTASAVALEDTELVVCAADKLRQLCESNHAFGYHLMQQMATALSKRLLATRLQLLDLFATEPVGVPLREPKEEG